MTNPTPLDTQTQALNHAQNSASGLRAALEAAALFVAPTTIITALAFYAGLVRTSRLLSYFGVDASLLGLTTQEYIFRSSEVLFVPLATILCGGLVGLIVHILIKKIILDMKRIKLRKYILGSIVGGMVLVGSPLTFIGLRSILTAKSFLDFTFLQISIGFTVGILLVSYGIYVWLWFLVGLPKRQGGGAGFYSKIYFMVSGLLAVFGIFWALSNYASALGEALAFGFESTLASRPSVILYSKDRLHIEAAGVVETKLTDAVEAYNFRYTGLKLLIRGRDRYLLIPQTWSSSDGRVVMLFDNESIRLDFSVARE